MCIEREKVDCKSREVNCLKECALALSKYQINGEMCRCTIVITRCPSSFPLQCLCFGPIGITR